MNKRQIKTLHGSVTPITLVITGAVVFIAVIFILVLLVGCEIQTGYIVFENGTELAVQLFYENLDTGDITAKLIGAGKGYSTMVPCGYYMMEVIGTGPSPPIWGPYYHTITTTSHFQLRIVMEL